MNIRTFLHKNKYQMLLAFVIPVVILAGVYASIGIYWGSDRSILASDAFSQFSNFHASYRNALLGKQSFFYTWNAALGLNYFALCSYYLGGFLTPLVIFFPNAMMPDALYLLTLLKIGTAALAFWIYAKNTFRLNRWFYLAFSTAYALMSFITAHSELIMWLDAFIFLPLIILGIDRLMNKRKGALLFGAYFCLFVTNFYMGFMIGVFSFLYYLTQLIIGWKKTKKTILPYLFTSILTGTASMIVVLPTYMDLRSNGEELTKITALKTEATGFFDLIIKNMIGVYDTTKYGSIPFLYIGLVPLIFCLFYFITPKIKRKNKLCFIGLFSIIISSFYLVPLNLFWHGMHAPNMFLFRYSFVFSFLVIMLACYGLEQYHESDKGYLVGTILFLGGLFILAKAFVHQDHYAYVSNQSFLFTLLFLALYLIAVVLFQLLHVPKKRIALLFLALMCFEATINTNSMINGILDDWVYASRSLYSDPYPALQQTVDQAKKQSEDEFFRLENLAPVSSNDSINYGYSGLSLFSSIRNRNTSSLLDQLGFRSRGTNLNLRYPNNTLLMDALFDVRYNITDQQNPQKYGFFETYHNQEYALYENKNALSLGVIADDSIYQTKFPKNDNLSSQTNLLNQLAQINERYFHFIYPQITNTYNTTVTYSKNGDITLSEQKQNIAKDVTWNIKIPAGKQAYLSLYPTDFSKLDSSTASIMIDQKPIKTQINITGQYYNLGYFEKETTIDVTVSFYGSKEVSFMKPPVVLLDLQAFQKAIDHIKPKEVDLDVGKRSVTGTVTIEKDHQTLFTTIPYDKGWQAKVDGKKVDIKPFKHALITLPLSKGTHIVQLTFLPQGFRLGVILLVISTCLFFFIKRKYGEILGI